MKKFLCAANWKMNKGPTETAEYLTKFLSLLPKSSQSQVAFFAPGYNLPAMQKALQGSSIFWGAQNCYFERSGAYTGELSPLVLQQLGATHCLVGHSERRQLFYETDEDVSKKVSLLQELHMVPMICVGETLEQRNQGKTHQVVLNQITQSLSRAVPEASFVLAYEPIWAIGTGQVATAQQAEEVHQWIRQHLVERIGPEAAKNTYVLYGGSVKPENSSELYNCPNIDGFLVGGASLEVESFLSLAETNLAFAKSH